MLRFIGMYVIGILFGIFLFNYSFNFIEIPFLDIMGIWIVFLAGIFLLVLSTLTYKRNVFLAAPFLIWGLYMIYLPFEFIKIPDFISSFNNIIIFIGGVLCFGAFILRSTNSSQ